MLNSVNHRFHSNIGDADIFIGEQFHSWEEISCALREEHLFTNVFTYRCPEKQGLFKYAWSKFKEIIDIEACMTSWLHEQVQLKGYEIIYMSLYTRFSYGIRELNPKAKVVFFEDGCGTYLGKEHEWGFEKRKKIFRLIGKEFPELQYSQLLVNNIDFYKLSNPRKESVSQLPQYDLKNVDFKNMLMRIFGLHEADAYYDQKVIYLSAPNDESIPNYETIEYSILACLKKEVGEFLIRLHPRQDGIEYDGYSMDKERKLWELVVFQSIEDNNVLVASFSTAQLVPKLLYNKEPFLVFLYPLFQTVNIDKKEIIVNNLKKVYSDPQKIKVIHDISDLRNLFIFKAVKTGKHGGH